MEKSNQFPRTVKPLEYKPGRYRRVKIWKVQSTIGEFIIYAVNAEQARSEFSRLKGPAVIISVNRQS